MENYLVYFRDENKDFKDSSVQNDKLELLKPGSLQHLGENMLAFLLKIASSSDLPEGKAVEKEEKSRHSNAIFFDILVTF